MNSIPQRKTTLFSALSGPALFTKRHFPCVHVCHCICVCVYVCMCVLTQVPLSNRQDWCLVKNDSAFPTQFLTNLAVNTHTAFESLLFVWWLCFEFDPMCFDLDFCSLPPCGQVSQQHNQYYLYKTQPHSWDSSVSSPASPPLSNIPLWLCVRESFFLSPPSPNPWQTSVSASQNCACSLSFTLSCWLSTLKPNAVHFIWFDPIETIKSNQI